MNRNIARRGMAALGLGMAIALSAGISASSAQTGPRVLPSSPDYQDRALDQPDRQYDRNYLPKDHDFGPNARDNDRSVRPEERLERRLEFLHAQLRIVPAQERAWQTFAAVLQDEARDRFREKRFEGRDRFRGPPSVVGRLEDRQQRLAERSADLDRVLRALRPLYASFSVEQRRTADRLMFQPGGGREFGRDDRQDREDRPGDYRF